eukprot:g2437.t1
MISFSPGTYLRGTSLLVEFYVVHLFTLLSLPEWILNHDKLHRILETHIKKKQEDSKHCGPLKLTVSNRARDSYNGAYTELKNKFRALHRKKPRITLSSSKDEGSSKTSFCTKAICGSRKSDPILLHSPIGYRKQLFLLVCIRFLSIAAAYLGSVKGTLALSSLQFLLAPYSLCISAALLVALAPPIYLAHFIVHVPLSFLSARVLREAAPFVTGPIASVLNFGITPGFILGFLFIDQLTCAYCYFVNPRVVDVGSQKLLVHVLWGFVNCKTMSIVLFLLMWRSGATFSILPLALDMAFGITRRVGYVIANLSATWASLFYHQHRLSHLPTVYEHAHKLHHYLHGSTAFDAHVYGNGMPEEWCYLWIEIVASLYVGIPPPTLNPHVLYLSWTNKVGHSENVEDDGGCNFHTDHHVRSSKNFGIFDALLDMYFETAVQSECYELCDAGRKWKIKKEQKKSEDDGTSTVFLLSAA